MLLGCVHVDIRSQEAVTAARRGSAADDGRCRLRSKGDIAVVQRAAVHGCQTTDAGPSAPAGVQKTLVVVVDVCL